MSSDWYARINRASGLLSGVIVVLFVLYSFVLSPSQGWGEYEISIIVAVMAGLHAVLAVVSRFITSEHSLRIYSNCSFALFTLMILLLILTSRDAGTLFTGFLVIVGLISGLFGVLPLLFVNITATTIVTLFATGFVQASPEYTFVSVAIHLVTLFVSFFLWHQAGSSPNVSTSKTSTTAGALSVDTFINSIADGVIITDQTGQIVQMNPAASTITGWEIDEALGLNFASVLRLKSNTGEDVTIELHPVRQAHVTGESTNSSDMKLQTKSDKQIEVDIITSAIVNEGATSHPVVVIFRDISKAKNEERQRAEFISTASHEMRTPVAAIEGYLALAMNEKVAKIDSTAREYLDKAHSSTQHLGKLFQDLLTAAKSEDGRLTSHPVAFEVGAFLDEIIEGVRFSAEKKGLLMEADFGGGSSDATAGAQTIRPVAYIYADPDRMREVITNLFDNAVKYTEEGKITIGMSIDDKSVMVRVSDTGNGIPADDVPHLFQKFYRVDNTATRQVGGTGLGLFICKKIVELYNGRIWVESEVGKGSDFIIAMPRISADRARQLMVAEQATASPLDTPVATPATPAPQPSPTTEQSPTPAPEPPLQQPAPAPESTQPATPVAATTQPVPTTPPQTTQTAQTQQTQKTQPTQTP